MGPKAACTLGRLGPTRTGLSRRAANWQMLRLLVASALCLAATRMAKGDGAPPPPGAVPPNASQVDATVLEPKVWSPESLRDLRPPAPLEQTLYSVTLDVHAAAAKQPDLQSLAQPRTMIQAFSSTSFPPNIAGKDVRATVKLEGDTTGSRWWISDIRIRVEADTP